MFTRLPFELRLLIWQFVLCEPRIVYINMRCLPGRLPQRYGSFPEYAFECISPTPIPVLLHLCKETRMLALAHYEITFGHPEAPRSPPRHALASSCDGNETDTGRVTQNQDLALTKCGPKIYINFEHDTVLFGRALQPLGEPSGGFSRFTKPFALFPPKEEVAPGQLMRIESLGLGFFPAGDHIGLSYLEYRVTTGEFPKLRNLYLCLQPSAPDFSQGVEFVPLQKCTEKNEDGVTRAQEFLNRCKSRMLLPRYNLRWLETEEALRAISRLNEHPHLRDLLLKNGADPDEPLKIIWAKEIKECGQKESGWSVSEATGAFRQRRHSRQRSTFPMMRTLFA